MVDAARAAYFKATKDNLYGFDSQRDAFECGYDAGREAAIASAVESCAEKLFKVWRTDQTGDTWRQLSESEQDAWRRVARETAL